MIMEQSLELHLNNSSRKNYLLENLIFSETGKLIVKENYQIQEITEQINSIRKESGEVENFYKSSDINALALIEKINHFLIKKYLLEADNLAFKSTLNRLNENYGKDEIDKIFEVYNSNFSGKGGIDLENQIDSRPVRELILEEVILLKICNNNQAAAPYKELFDDTPLIENSRYTPVFYTMLEHFDETPSFGPGKNNLIKLLMEPAQHHPHSLQAQIEYMKDKWPILTDEFLLLLLKGIDKIREENKAFFNGPGPSSVLEFGNIHNREEDDTPNFSPDSNWMPEVILLAKNALVWLDQLSRDYKREIRSLNQIPNEELDVIASRGINCLWLIGIWDRSNASKEIKKRCGNADAVSSAYSLFSYDISYEIGGWDSLTDLRNRCKARGIRLASDMVPNHTGIDSEWTRSRPHWFIQTDRPPFPSYTYSSENLSEDPGIGIYLEDHYYDKSDAAVTFKRVNFHTREERYIYHGNDGTSMPWNDTAQLDFLQHEVREAVIDQILHVARNFPVIRFDAAMTLAKKHIQRLWYPEPGKGGDIASRSNFAISHEDFEKAMGGEFWKEVVSRVSREAPDTLLLAEAFWMMEGYFVRNLGMHRVYNSAFMNMMKNEENDKYRDTIKSTLNYDRKILKRFVNFMNNPDEETAAVQFGTGDKYFGVMTLMLTMPGLPMIGHGQIEGYKEKYGMEFKKPLWDEYPDPGLVERHEQEIFPILKKRYLFVSAKNFRLYDLCEEHDSVNDNVFAFTNQNNSEQVLVLYNNSFEQASGYIKTSVPYIENSENESLFLSNSLGETLNLTNDGEYYCLLKEIKTGTWFIRNSMDIYENGLYIQLDGYKSQVFTDIHELKNSESNHIREIADKLNGSGTKDLDREYREMIFKPLYNRLNSLINKEIITQLQSADLNLKDLSKELKENIESTVKAVKEFSGGTGEISSITEKIMESMAQQQQRLPLLNNNEKLSELFQKSFTFEKKLTLYILSIFEQFGSIVSAKEGWRINRDLFDSWMLGKYLNDILSDMNYSNEFISSLISGLRFFTESYNKEKPLFEKSIDIKTINELQKMKGFSTFLGINMYEKTLWFSKEKFESFLWWTQYKSLIEQKNPDLNRLYKTIEKWKKASVKSEYDFDTFMELIM
jgi:glycosidase